MKNKYVLILSDEDDRTTDDVLDWLDHKSIPFIRINGTNYLSFKNLSITEKGEYNYTLNGKQHAIDPNLVLSFWYRRGKIAIPINYLTGRKNQKLQKRQPLTQDDLLRVQDIIISSIKKIIE